MGGTQALGADALGVAETAAAPGTQPTAVKTPLRPPATPTLASTQSRTRVLPRRAGEGTRTEAGAGRRFHHVKPLGEGGMGEVLLAHDEDIQRRVAIKRMRGEKASEAMLLRFAEEVRIIGQLEHPSIVPVHDVGVDDDGQVYLVMKYVEGETLEHVLERLRAGDTAYVRRFPMRERVEIVAKILEALSYAHARGFVHRDLKPANVMVGPHGEVTLMDWGIAKRIGDAEPAVDELATTHQKSDRLVETQQGALLGTPLYMSPEQAAGRNAELDARSDVFSVGLVAVELFSLVHPLQDLPAMSAVLATLIHKNLGTFKVVSECFAKAGSAPAELMWFAVGALGLDPKDRYADAAAMLDELRSLQGGKIRAQCPITATKAATNVFLRWIDRHPTTYMVLLSTAAVLVLAGLGTGVWLGVRALLH